LAIALPAILLSACGATSYHEINGIAGGVQAQQMTASTYRITALGNGLTSSSQIEDYTLLKAAETTKQAGATYFAFVGAEDAATGAYSPQRVISYGSEGHRGGNQAASAKNYSSIREDAFIHVFIIAAGQPPPPGSISADEIIRFVGASLTWRQAEWRRRNRIGAWSRLRAGEITTGRSYVTSNFTPCARGKLLP
jgi:hypothetical protein